jgi:LPXTG-motif cell wall-anchored protein
MALPIAAAIPAVVTGIAGLFKSKKHYHLYYFETADNTWHFVMDGIPSQINPVKAQYAAQGYAVYTARNKDAKYQPGELAPKNPPTGVTSKSATGINWMLIIAVVAGLGLVFFFIKRKKK